MVTLAELKKSCTAIRKPSIRTALHTVLIGASWPSKGTEACFQEKTNERPLRVCKKASEGLSDCEGGWGDSLVWQNP